MLITFLLLDRLQQVQTVFLHPVGAGFSFGPYSTRPLGFGTTTGELRDRQHETFFAGFGFGPYSTRPLGFGTTRRASRQTARDFFRKGTKYTQKNWGTPSALTLFTRRLYKYKSLASWNSFSLSSVSVFLFLCFYFLFFPSVLG